MVTEVSMSPDLAAILQRTQTSLFGADDTVCLERARLVCEYSVEMGYHSSIADCMAEEE